MDSQQRSVYLPALDGLRAGAVLSVVGLHTGNSLFRGGALGVDVFFVLSGFLITTLLAAEFERRGKIDLGRFYVRRVRRLMPALLALCLVTVTTALVVHSVRLTPGFAVVNAALAFTYLMDVAISFFPSHFHDMVLFHTWSLGVETYFYLVWPPVLVMALRRGWSRGRIAKTLAVPVVLVWALRVATWAAGRDQQVLYAFHLRSDQLLIGAAVGLVLPQLVPLLQSSRRGQLVNAGAYLCALLLAVAVVMPARVGYLATAGYLAVAVQASVLIVSVVAYPTTMLARVLAWQPIRYIGWISYSLYLWHFFVNQVFPSGFASRPVVIAAHYATSFLLAIASFHLIEQRFSSSVRRRGRTLSAAADPKAVRSS